MNTIIKYLLEDSEDDELPIIIEYNKKKDTKHINDDINEDDDNYNDIDTNEFMDDDFEYIDDEESEDENNINDDE